MPFAYTVKYVDEVGVLLAVYIIELYSDIVNISQSLTTEEIRSRICASKHTLVFGRDDRSKLRKVANHQKLYAAERLAPVTKMSEDSIYSIQHIAANHGYFINDNHVK